MKVKVFDWCGETHQQLAALEYENRKVLEVDEKEVWAIAQRIFATGLNVLLYHAADGSIVIGVDTKRFQMR